MRSRNIKDCLSTGANYLTAQCHSDHGTPCHTLILGPHVYGLDVVVPRRSLCWVLGPQCTHLETAGPLRGNLFGKCLNQFE